MLKRLLLGFWLILIGVSLPGQSHDFLFRKVSPDGGFSYRSIENITEDKNGFIWFSSRNSLYRYNSRQFDAFYESIDTTISTANIRILDLFTDKKGQLWVATNRNLFAFDERQQRFFALFQKPIRVNLGTAYFANLIENSQGEIFAAINGGIFSINRTDNSLTPTFEKFDTIRDASYVNIDPLDNMWIGTTNGNVYKSEKPYREVEMIWHRPGGTVIDICHDNNSLWIGYSFDGLDHITPQGSLIQFYSESSKPPHQLPSNRVRTIAKDSANRIWIGTYKGISLLTEGRVKQIEKNSYNQLPHGAVHSLFFDSNNGLWVGTWSGGLAYLDDRDNHFIHFNRTPEENSLYKNVVGSFCEDENNNIWVATEDGGLNEFNRNLKKFTKLSSNKNDSDPTNIKCITYHNKKIWIGTFSNGMWVFDTQQKRFYRPKHLLRNLRRVYDIVVYEDVLLIGTFRNGLYTYDTKNGNIINYRSDRSDSTTLSSNLIRVVLADRHGGFWVGTEYGLNYKPKGSEQFTQYRINSNNPSFNSDQIFALNEDSRGRIWIGTGGGGVNCYNPETDTIIKLTKEDGLPGNSVFGILEDDNGMMWFSTENGISRYSPENGVFKNFTTEDGLQGKQFNPSAAWKCSNGELLFGGPNGFNLINPENIKHNFISPEVFLTKIEINNQKSATYSSDSTLLSALYSNNKIKLKFSQNSVNFEFVSNSFVQPGKNRFRYRLTNYQNDWIDAGNEGKAIFTKLPSGNYTFEVIAANNDGIWSKNPARQEIRIIPPIWRSNLAFLIYLIIIIWSTWFIRKEVLYRKNLRKEFLLEKYSRKKDEELHQIKLRFFTNISHEFRTPITLIISPLKQILDTNYFDQDTREKFSIIQRNAYRLRRLINQIIDFRKIEFDKLDFSESNTDILQFCKEICSYFETHAKDKSINFQMISSLKKIIIPVDQDKLDKILFNLLSNALKFTPDGGKVDLKIDDGDAESYIRKADYSTNPELQGEVICFSISDTGPGVNAENISSIFERFNQSAKSDQPLGTGIGLNLSSEYVKLHGGAITVENLSKSGVVFSVLIPILPDAIKEEARTEIVKSIYEDVSDSVKQEDLNIDTTASNHEPSTSVLLVEDNIDMRKQIKNLLSKDYKVISASNGTQGLEIAREIFPDIIISDILMPGIDGIELCEKIKSDVHTSHIPVILLTAISETENHIKGLDTGADAYLTKPFDNMLLKAQIANLINARKQLRKSFKESDEKWLEDTNLNRRDKALIDMSLKIVEKHLLDTNFSVDQLADELGISRSSLHRKLKALTNQTATEFIRYVRMKKAIRLMKESEMNIDEIGFAVGFNSHSYFSQSFKKMYGKTPTNYMSELRMNKKS